MFRCEGEVYYGYRDRCIDFAKVSTQNRWSKKTDDALHNYINHHVFNDGREPDCSQRCNYWSKLGGYSVTAAIWLTCIAATAGSAGISASLCLAGLGGAAGGLTSFYVGDQASTVIAGMCRENHCRGY